MPKFDQRTAKLLLIAVLIIRALFTFNRSLNADEFQHLHNAWMIHLGFLPYRDFWDNHTPLLQNLIAPLFGILGEGHSAVMFVRGLVSACSLIILIPVYKIGRAFIDKGAAWNAVLFLSISEIFLQKTIEVRPDFALVFFFLLSLWFCIQPSPRFLAGGVMVGMAALFSPKALVAFAVAIPFLPFAIAPVNLRLYLKRAAAYAAGFLIPICCLALYFYWHNALNDMIRCALLENFTYPHERRATFLLLPQNLVFLLLSFSGVWLWFRKNGRRQPLSILFAIALALVFLLAFVMPAPFSQSALMFLPILAIGAAYAVQQSTGIFKILAMVAAIVIPGISILVTNPLKKANEAQFNLMSYVLQNTSKDETIFDGNAAYIFRKQAFYYGSLVEGVRQRIRSGTVNASIPESLTTHSCRVIIDDDRVSTLSADFQTFLHNNYVATDYPGVYVAGKNLQAENLTGRHAKFTIEVPMKYTVETGAKDFRIDQRNYDEPVYLKKGVHTVTADVDLAFVKIRGE